MKSILGTGFDYEGLGDDARAAAAFEEVLKLQPGNEPAKERLAAARKRIDLSTQPEWVRQVVSADDSISQGEYAAAGRTIEEGLKGAGADAEKDQAQRKVIQDALYNLGCIYAQLSVRKESSKAPVAVVTPEEAAKRRDTAFAHLAKAIDLGFDQRDHLAADADLAPLHDDPRWKELLGRLGKPK